MTVTTAPSIRTSMGSASVKDSSPLGPLTVTSRSCSAMLTPEGTLMGARPILLIVSYLPHECHDFAAATASLGLPAAHHALRRRKNDEAEPAHALRDLAFRRVDPQAGFADALQSVDHALAVLSVFERDADNVARLARDEFEVLDEAFRLEELCDLLLQARGGHVDALVKRRVRVLDAGEHVRDGIGYHCHSLSLSLRFLPR